MGALASYPGRPWRPNPSTGRPAGGGALPAPRPGYPGGLPRPPAKIFAFPPKPFGVPVPPNAGGSPVVWALIAGAHVGVILWQYLDDDAVAVYKPTGVKFAMPGWTEQQDCCVPLPASRACTWTTFVDWMDGNPAVHGAPLCQNNSASVNTKGNFVQDGDNTAYGGRVNDPPDGRGTIRFTWWRDGAYGRGLLTNPLWAPRWNPRYAPEPGLDPWEQPLVRPVQSPEPSPLARPTPKPTAFPMQPNAPWATLRGPLARGAWQPRLAPPVPRLAPRARPPLPRPPKPNEKERKTRGKGAQMLHDLMGNVTEALDAAMCFFEALPKEHKKGVTDGFGIANALYGHFHDVNLNQVVKCLVANQVEDGTIGLLADFMRKGGLGRQNPNMRLLQLKHQLDAEAEDAEGRQ